MHEGIPVRGRSVAGTRTWAWALGLTLALSGLAGPGWGRPPLDPERPPIVDPRGDRVLRSMGAYLRDAPQFSLCADITYDDVLASGQKVQYAALQDVAVRRPDRVYGEYEGDVGAKRVWYDGTQLTVLDTTAGVYAKAPMPAKIDAALDRLLQKYGFTPPLSDLLTSDPYTTLAEHAQFGLYLGEHVVRGVRCHHLAFVDKFIDWQIWVENGTQIVPRKLVITYKTLPSQPQFEAVLSHWNFEERLSDVSFEPVLPEGVVQLDFLEVGLGPGAKKAEGGKR